MDNYSLDEVKNIIENDNLSAYMLRSMLDNAIRRIEIYSDDEGVVILEYILKNAVIPLEIKEEISQYLTNISLEKESVCNEKENDEVKSQNKRIFFLLGVILILVIIFFIVK